MPAQVIGNQATAVELYVAFAGLAPSNAVYQNWLTTANSTSGIQLALQVGQSYTGVSDATLAASVLANMGISAATTNQVAFDTLSAALVQVFAAYPGAQRAVVVYNMVNLLSGLEGNATYGAAATAWNNTTLNAFTYASNTANTAPGPISSTPPAPAPSVLTLTTGLDNLVGTAGNDTFNGGLLNSFSAFDNLDGGAGTDVLNVLTSAIGLPGGETVKNIETVSIATTGAGFTADTTSGYTGLTSLSVSDSAAGAINVTVGASTASSVVATALGTNAITVNGGTDATVAATVATGGATGGAISIGATTAVTGAVKVTETVAITAGQAAGAISVKGGTTVSVAETATVVDAVAATATQSAVTVTGTANTTAVTVSQSAAVAAVKEKFEVTFGADAIGGKTIIFDGVTTTTGAGAQTAAQVAAAVVAAGATTNWVPTLKAPGSNIVVYTAATAGSVADVTNVLGAGTYAGTISVAAPSTQGTAALVDGAVTITDLNATSLTAANTISSVTLNNYGASTIASNALANLSLTGTGGTLALTNAATVKQTALNLTVNKLSGSNTITDTNNGLTTLNVTATGADSVLAGISATGVTALTVAGDKVLELTSATGMTNLKTATVSGAAGLKANVSAMGTVTSIDASNSSGANTITLNSSQTTYAGGSGVDTVTVGEVPTKAISGGAGTADELVINVAAGTFSNPSTNTKISGFEVLGLGTAATGSYNATGFTALHIGSTVTGDVTFSNVAAGTKLSLDAAPGQNVFYVLNDATGTSDAVNVQLATAKSTGIAFAGKNIDVTGVETINVSSLGDGTGVNTVKFADTTATKSVITTINVTGVATTVSTALTGTSSITSVDASAVTEKTAGSLVNDLSGITVSSAGATIKGSLTVSNTLTGQGGADTIIGGARADTITGGGGLDILTGNGGNDTFVFGVTTSGNAYATVTDANKGDILKFAAGNGTEAFTATKLAPLGATAVFQDYLDLATATDASGTSTVKWFQYNGDTYIVEDNSAALTFQNGADTVVKLTGLVDLNATGHVAVWDAAANTLTLA